MIGATQPHAGRQLPYCTRLAYAWGAEHRAETCRDICDMVVSVAMTAAWIIGGAVIGRLMTWA